MNKTCIISVGIGEGYAKGIDRMAESLKDVGYQGDTMFWKDIPEGFPTHEENPYSFKVLLFIAAISKGYKRILWLDASIYAIKPLDYILDKIESQGYYLVSNGYNARQECNDKCLDYFGIDYDKAVNIPMISSGIVGLNFDLCRPPFIGGNEFVNRWKRSLIKGVFQGSRSHNIDESSDPRFLNHRQDQSAASCIAHQLKMDIEPLGKHVAYYDQGVPESAILIIKGF